MFEISLIYPLLEDFRKFMEFLKEEECPLAPKSNYLSKGQLWRLNQHMHYRTENTTPNLNQESYPLLHLFYHLALAGNLTVLLPTKGNRLYLKVANRFEEYLSLTMCEQYIFLLETFWMDTDWEILQKSTGRTIPNERFISSVWHELSCVKPDEPLYVRGSQSSWQSMLEGWGYFLWYFTYFGFWRFTQDEEALKVSRRNIKALSVTPTDFGVQVAPVFFKYRDYLDWNQENLRKCNLTSQDILNRLEALILSMGQKPKGFAELAGARKACLREPFYKKFVSLFPSEELKRTLPRNQQKFSEGTYRLKVSLSSGEWREIELAAKHTLHQLHLVIQKAFGVTGEHVYNFLINKKVISHDRVKAVSKNEGVEAEKIKVGDLELYPGKIFVYEIDYESEWKFKVKVEEVSADKPLPLRPRIIGKQDNLYAEYKLG